MLPIWGITSTLLMALASKQSNNNMITTSTNNLKNNLKVAIIGSGGAGIITSRILQKNNITNIKIFEKNDDIGGVWNYNNNKNNKNAENKRKNPMYKHLRTNLPKEIMSLREKPWGCWNVNNDKKEKKEPSYVTHEDVLLYLKEYINDHDLNKYINYQCEVKQLTFLDESTTSTTTDNISLLSPSLVQQSSSSPSPNHNNDEAEDEVWPCIEIKYHNSQTNTNHKEIFDMVCICNGHYSLPYQANIIGIDDYNGIFMHSIDYDTPEGIITRINDNKDKNDNDDITILCIGGRASGSDIARELSSYSIENKINAKIYLSDSSFPIDDDDDETNNDVNKPQTMDDVTYWLPKTTKYNTEHNYFEFDNTNHKLSNVDMIIVCTGYDYNFPFINDKSNLDSTTTNTKNNNTIRVKSGERYVSSLYKQLWYTKYPNLSFVGLQHSVIPFPLFEFQAEAIVSQILNNGLTGSESVLPNYKKRQDWARDDMVIGGYKKSGILQDIHYLGGYQWEYFRELANISMLYNDTIEDYISTSKAIYEHSGSRRKNIFPGGFDEYRYDSYTRDDKNRSFKVSSCLPVEVTN